MWICSRATSRQRLWHIGRHCYRVSTPMSPLDVSRQRALAKKLASAYETIPKVASLIDAYRNHGHKFAKIDPLSLAYSSKEKILIPELDPATYSLSSQDRINPKKIFYGSVSDNTSVSELTEALQTVYCGSIGIELNHVSSLEEREWLTEHFENRHALYPVELKDKIRAACLMRRSLEFENFIGVKFPTVKRYSGEGSESMLVSVDEVLAQASGHGVSSSVIGMPHRGRNSLLTCVLGHEVQPFLLKMRGMSEFPAGSPATGDTFSHFHLAADVQFGADARPMHVSLLPNPSHLEAVAPVAVGKARAKMKSHGDGDYNADKAESARNGDSVLCIQIHGDASMPGQGVIAETASLANVANFTVGGSVHLVVNNQIGFTTEADSGRSFAHPTDLVAKGLSSPVLHVNGDDIDEVIRASRLAVDYRQRFRRDVFVDLICYRRWGHNELDDPSLTQPVMYARIQAMPPLPETFTQSFTDEEAKKAVNSDTQQWNEHHQMALRNLDQYQPKPMTFGGQWAGLGPAPGTHLTMVPTGVPADRLYFVGETSVTLPDDFDCHPTLLNHHIKRRKERLASGNDLDWATAEALAVGSLLQEGHDCRISGQDVGRGTFSHRHFMFVDQKNDAVHIPFQTLGPSPDGVVPGLLEVVNSPLSEEAVLSFEYGYSLEDPNRLVIWEAQFGDFFNAAQVPIDTYVASGEAKWLFQSNLVMLLPHGYDGAGPEHSSCRLERFLQLCDSRETISPPDGEDRNLNIVNPTTPAQYFHVLRRQMKRSWRKPLIVVGPKLLLRHPQATSRLEEMGPGTSFRHVLGDPAVAAGRVDPNKVKRVVFCSGKHFYVLLAAREAQKAWDTALVRIEQLCPFPIVEIAQEAQRFPAARTFVWSQEEHRNMGAWTFARVRLETALGVRMEYAGRAELATPAVGIAALHKAEAGAILENTFGHSSA